jgi:hypothetical protein
MTFSIGFTRAFTHTDWVDNVDRVEAGGDNGFNARFHSLERDLDSVSGTFVDVEGALNTLETPPAAHTSFSSFAPAFVATAQAAWSFRDGFAEKPGTATTANGQAPIQLPHGQTITTFRATGQNSSASGVLRIGLYRRPLTNPGFQLIVRLQPTENPFNASADVEPDLAAINNERFSYFVLATASTSQAADVMTVMAMQVTHVTQ